jgi:hypothetical protein
MPESQSRIGRALSAFTQRLLDKSRKRDYLYAALFAGGPMLAAWWAGNHKQVDVCIAGAIVSFPGFWQRYNWSSHVLLVPAGLFLFRWAMGRIASVMTPDVPADVPGVIELVRAPEGRAAAYHDLRSALLQPSNLGFALLVAAVFTVFDASFLRIYFQDNPQLEPYPDWSSVFMTGKVSKWRSFAQVLYAYGVQGAIVTLLALFMTLVFRHNSFFLSRVYQRRRVAPGAHDQYIVIDLDDTDRCFGFRRADTAFNTQVSCLALAGIGLMLSRIANVKVEDGLLAFEVLHRVTPFLRRDHTEHSLGGLFPDFGQWAIVLGWIVGFAVVTSPALVKFLPRVPFTGAGREQATLVGYLREFLPDSYWPFGENPSGPEVNDLSARFASNAFWPTGNNRATSEFTLAAFWGLVLAFPVVPLRGRYVDFFIALVVMGVLASVLTWLAYKALQTRLVAVDERLVTIPPSAPGPASPQALPIVDRFEGQVFISYRRDDAVAWAKLLHDTLEGSCYPDRIFRDIDGIPFGKNFGDVIEEMLVKVDVAIVLIGPRWLNATLATGARRLDDPSDWVRLEVARALSRSDVLVVPALLGGTRMPSPQELPDALKPLAALNAIELSDSRWDYDVGRLVGAMREQFEAALRNRDKSPT